MNGKDVRRGLRVGRMSLKFQLFIAIVGLLAHLAGPVLGVQIVTHGAEPVCQTLQLRQELPVFKDPSLFLSNLGLLYADPVHGVESLIKETPLLTTLKKNHSINTAKKNHPI